MNQQEWLDLIPFYVNGTLNEQERRQFNQYLAENLDDAVYIDQWREIAEATVLLVQPATVRLPPISKAVRDALHPVSVTPLPRLNDNDTHQQATHPGSRIMPPPPLHQPSSSKLKHNDIPPGRLRKHRATGTGITLAAAVLVMISMGILLSFPNRLLSDNPTAIALLGTKAIGDIGAPVADTPPNNTLPTSVFPAMATPVVASVQLNIIPTNVPPMASGGVGDQTIMIPSNTPPVIGGGQSDISAAQLMPLVSPVFHAFPENRPTEDAATICRISNATGANLPVYLIPDGNSSVMYLLPVGDLLIANQIYDDNWYQVIVPMVGFGWIQKGAVAVNEACEILPMAISYEVPTVIPTQLP